MRAIGAENNLEILQIEVDELKNSIHHLERSNRELLEADPDDADYKLARRENADLIRRKQQRIDDIYAEMLKAPHGAHVAPPSPSPSPSPSPNPRTNDDRDDDEGVFL